MTRCWRCGRATSEYDGRAFVFGRVCDRADCRKVREGLSDCDAWHWFKICLPEPNPASAGGYPGRGGSYSIDGERQTPRGMCEPDLQDKIGMDRQAGLRGGESA